MSPKLAGIRWLDERDQALGMVKLWNPLAWGSDVCMSARVPSGSDLMCDEKGIRKSWREEWWRIFAAARASPSHPRPQTELSSIWLSDYSTPHFSSCTSLLIVDLLVDRCTITKRNRRRTMIIAIEFTIR
jgi:hypothetical protein